MRSKKPYPNQLPCATISQPGLYNDSTRSHDSPVFGTSGRMRVPQDHLVMHSRSPANLPDPWLFDSEKLLRELDRCREMILLIPAPTHETHFAINIAVNAIWNLREQLRFLLHLRHDAQQAFGRKHKDASNGKSAAIATTKLSAPARMKQKRAVLISQAEKAIS